MVLFCISWRRQSTRLVVWELILFCLLRMHRRSFLSEVWEAANLRTPPLEGVPSVHFIAEVWEAASLRIPPLEGHPSVHSIDEESSMHSLSHDVILWFYMTSSRKSRNSRKLRKFVLIPSFFTLKKEREKRRGSNPRPLS